ncbi:Uromodulin-like 1, partial [Paramuricea clavata]
VVASVQGGIRIINRNFEPEYNDTTSAGYFQITQVIIVALEANYRNTRFGAFFVGIIITRIYPGSVGVDYVAGFNNSNGVNNQNLQQELISTLNYTTNGTFLGDSDLKLSEETNRTKVAEALTFQDYDECNPAVSVHTPDCGNNATCVNTNTSYDCICDAGFIQNGTGCNSAPTELVQVDKESVKEVTYLISTVLIFLVSCVTFSIVFTMLSISEIIQKKRHAGLSKRVERIQLHGQTYPDPITAPSYRGSASLSKYYDY